MSLVVQHSSLEQTHIWKSEDAHSSGSGSGSVISWIGRENRSAFDRVAEKGPLLGQLRLHYGHDPVNLGVEDSEASVHVLSRVGTECQAVKTVGVECVMDRQLFLQCLHGTDFGFDSQLELMGVVHEVVDILRRRFLVVDQFAHVGSEPADEGLDALRSRGFLGVGLAMRTARLDSLLGWL
ncbi:hypothetical protein PG996_003003 [Apiospora saccharicola]|uniref:Uncharacterized protein n=1 Tax=Apiospora saccharicola TaxID=335842 RepID=A0ABR1W3V4_9PEZI